MKFNALHTWFAVALLTLASAALGAPGNPIGGIIVKGGKNPGGQMRAMATTDAAGKFRIRFAEGGQYLLEFGGSASQDADARMKNGLQVDYLIERAEDMAAGGKPKADARRHTPFHNRLVQGWMVVNVPDGGGELRGTLQASVPDKDAAAKGIQENGACKTKSGQKKDNHVCGETTHL